MSGPHTRVFLQRNTKFEACAEVVVDHTGQCIGWLRVQEVIDFLRKLGIYVRPPSDSGFR